MTQPLAKTYDYMVASRWRNRETVVELVDKLRAKGKTVYSFLEGDGSDYELKDTEQCYEPEEFMKVFENIPNWQTDPGVREIFEVDMQAFKNSDGLILLLPAGKSSHIEAGVAYGLGKRLIVIGQQPETESLYLIFDQFYDTIDQFIDSLQKT